MQVSETQKPEMLIDELIGETFPDRRGIAAWGGFLRAHATLMRQMATSLVEQTGLTMGDFDVLAQLSLAGGELRMTELAANVFSSRANMTRRIDRLVEEGMVRRTKSDTDARGVVITLTDAGLNRLAETVPVHLSTVAALFVAPLDDEELAVLERVMTKITHDCTFG